MSVKVGQPTTVTSYPISTESFGLVGHVIYTPDCGYVYQPMGGVYDERLELGGVEVSYDTLEAIQAVLVDYYEDVEKRYKETEKDQMRMDRFAVNPH